MTRFRLFTLVAFLGGAARASNVSNEFTVNTTQATESNPRSGSVGDSLNASFDISDSVDVNLGAMVTTQDSLPPPAPAFSSPSSVVGLFSAGFDWEMNDNWTLALTGELSPQSTTYADAPVGGVGTAHIRSAASELAGMLDLSYDTAGESNLEWSFMAGTTLANYSVDQTIPRVTDLAGTVLTNSQVTAAINNYCTKGKGATIKNCGRRVKRQLSATPFDLTSLEISAGVTAIVKKDTDLTLSGDFYNYFQDATQAGYASLIFIGRSGAGVPVAPLKFLIRPEVLHRFGDFSAKLWVQAGQYVQGVGQSTAGVGLKLQYKITKTLKIWTTLLGSRDVDDQNRETKSGALSIGMGYRF